MAAKYPRPGLPGYAYGGQVGNEILDFQRQYNPFTGDLPTYGMVGSQQPGAWTFFDDAWLRSSIPQPPSNVVDAPPGPPIMGPTHEGPDGGGADRYQDDWHGINVAQAISPDYTNLESFAGYNVPAEPSKYGSYEDYVGIGHGPSVNAGQPMESAPPAGWGYGGEDDMFAANMAAEQAALAAQGQPGGVEIGGRRGAPNRGPSDLSFDPLTGATTQASNPDYVPADEYVAPPDVQFAEPINYGGASLSPETMAEMQGQLGAYAAGPDRGWSVGIDVDPNQVGAAIGANAGPGSLVGINDYAQGQMGAGGSLGSQGMGAMTGMAEGPIGQAGLAALGGLVSTASPEAFVAPGEQPGRGFENKSGLSGISAMAGGQQSGPMGLGSIAAPGTPGFGAATALAEMFGLTQDIGLGLTPGQPMEPTNTVAGPVGTTVAAPTMDPLAGLTSSQIDALAAGYHDQAPAVGQASPVAGFETALAAAQAAAESKGRGGYSLDQDYAKGTTNTSSGGHFAGYNNNGEMVFVGSDKQGATGQDKGDTGDNGQGQGQGGGEDSGGKDSNSDTSGNSSAEGGTGGTGQGGGSGDPEGAGGTGEGGQGGGKKAGGRIRSPRGLPGMAQELSAAGRGKDTVLAHITPKEAMRLDAAMGGPSFNPETGLREYGFFDDVGDFLGGAAKAVAPIAGGVLGGMFGGPLGAAAGAALGTALTGGSLEKSLLAGGVAGIGAYAAPKLSSGLGGLMGGGNGEAGPSMMGANGMQTGGGSQSSAGGGDFLSGIMGNPLAMIGLGTAGTLGAGYLFGGDDEGGSSPMSPTQPAPPTMLRQGTLAPRTYTPYQGDYSTYGQIGGGAGHSFYDTVNPGVQWYAEGGSVQSDDATRRQLKSTLGQEVLSGMGPDPMRLLQTAQMAMPRNAGLPPAVPTQQAQPQQPQQLPPPPMPPTGQPGAWQQQAMPAWMMAQENNPEQRVTNLLNLAASGGRANGPGGGQDDMIPAMLSDGEYVIPADVTSHIGGGSNDAGANKLDALMKRIREQRNSGGTGLPPLLEEGVR